MQLNFKNFSERLETCFPCNTVTSPEADGSLFRYHYAEHFQQNIQDDEQEVGS